jgi:hypothetical protein
MHFIFLIHCEHNLKRFVKFLLILLLAFTHDFQHDKINASHCLSFLWESDDSPLLDYYLVIPQIHFSLKDMCRRRNSTAAASTSILVIVCGASIVMLQQFNSWTLVWCPVEAHAYSPLFTREEQQGIISLNTLYFVVEILWEAFSFFNSAVNFHAASVQRPLSFFAERCPLWQQSA